MEAVMKRCQALGWERLEDAQKDEYPKPVFQFGNWKCLIGHLWTTVWHLNRSGENAEIGVMESAKTEDVGAVMKLISGAMA